MVVTNSLQALVVLALGVRVSGFESAHEFRSLLQPLDSNVDNNAKDYYLGYKDSDYNTPWAKYFNNATVALNQGFLQGLERSPVSPQLGIPYANASAALNKPGYLALENGYTTLDDGTLYLAIRSDVPSNFTGNMYDFWFSWHTNDTTKYKLWNPQQHQYASASKADIQAEKGKKSYRERYWNFTSFVDEYIGDTAYKLSIGFFDPSIAGFSNEVPATGVETIVMGYVQLFSYTDEDPAAMAKKGLQPLNVILAHQVRRKPDGSGKEIRSRFWFGSLLVSGMKLVMPQYQLAHDLSVHCATEMTHLGTFLPALFKEFKSDIPTVAG